MGEEKFVIDLNQTVWLTQLFCALRFERCESERFQKNISVSAAKNRNGDINLRSTSVIILRSPTRSLRRNISVHIDLVSQNILCSGDVACDAPSLHKLFVASAAEQSTI